MVIALNGSSVDVMATLAWLFKKQLTEAVVAAVREAGGPDDDAIPTAARPKMLASARSSLLEIERIEEAAIEEIEATGAMFERRPMPTRAPSSTSPATCDHHLTTCRREGANRCRTQPTNGTM